MGFSALTIPLDEGKFHFIHTIDQTLHGSSRKLARVISNFFREHCSRTGVQVLVPSLALFIPLWKNEYIVVLFFSTSIKGVAVDLTSDTYNHIS